MSAIPPDTSEFTERAVTAAMYESFAERIAAPSSALYADLALGVSNDEPLLDWLMTVTPHQRHPNLLLAAVRYLDGLKTTFPRLRDFVLNNADAVREVMESHHNQTHAIGRACAIAATLSFEAITTPIALIEIGAGTGTGLCVDKFHYDFGGICEIGPMDSLVHLKVRVHGPFPQLGSLPPVVWRCGIDRSPINPDDSASVRWVEACIWPCYPEELAHFRQALAIVRETETVVLRGDALDLLDEALALAPASARPVVIHSAAVSYMPRVAREHLVARILRAGALWISNEPPWALGYVHSHHSVPVTPAGSYLVARDGVPLAISDSHGRWLRWL